MIRLVDSRDSVELRLKQSDYDLKIRRKKKKLCTTTALPAPKKSASYQPQLKCPMAGTFYISNRTVRCQNSICKKKYLAN
ncbi:hypothetical protein MTR_6g014990 [Medicago truncatula]|uniref:Uncharacterized protein n=1 Tax=Medicago truncatula TaxID=3880 RepID=G7KMP1_MEDTR|nr:hypothetical protein MTR_6g014990 [Medicago truncatula]